MHGKKVMVPLPYTWTVVKEASSEGTFYDSTSISYVLGSN
jgi:hypothetical protein